LVMPFGKGHPFNHRAACFQFTTPSSHRPFTSSLLKCSYNSFNFLPWKRTSKQSEEKKRTAGSPAHSSHTIIYNSPFIFPRSSFTLHLTPSPLQKHLTWPQSSHFTLPIIYTL
jgi:hypothetical protein